MNSNKDNFRRLVRLFLVLSTLLPVCLHAQPEQGGKGMVTRGFCQELTGSVAQLCGSATLHYEFSSLMGEPISHFGLKWKLASVHVRLSGKNGIVEVPAHWHQRIFGDSLQRLTLTAHGWAALEKLVGPSDPVHTLSTEFDTGVATRQGEMSWEVAGGSDWDKLMMRFPSCSRKSEGLPVSAAQAKDIWRKGKMTLYGFKACGAGFDFGNVDKVEEALRAFCSAKSDAASYIGCPSPKEGKDMAVAAASSAPQATAPAHAASSNVGPDNKRTPPVDAKASQPGTAASKPAAPAESQVGCTNAAASGQMGRGNCDTADKSARSGDVRSTPERSVEAASKSLIAEPGANDPVDAQVFVIRAENNKDWEYVDQTGRPLFKGTLDHNFYEGWTKYSNEVIMDLAGKKVRFPSLNLYSRFRMSDGLVRSKVCGYANLEGAQLVSFWAQRYSGRSDDYVPEQLCTDFSEGMAVVIDYYRYGGWNQLPPRIEIQGAIFDKTKRRLATLSSDVWPNYESRFVGGLMPVKFESNTRGDDVLRCGYIDSTGSTRLGPFTFRKAGSDALEGRYKMNCGNFIDGVAMTRQEDLLVLILANGKRIYSARNDEVEYLPEDWQRGRVFAIREKQSLVFIDRTGKVVHRSDDPKICVDCKGDQLTRHLQSRDGGLFFLAARAEALRKLNSLPRAR